MLDSPDPCSGTSSRGRVAALCSRVRAARAQSPPRPAPPLSRSDIFLAPQAQVIEAIVPPHATLDGLLRALHLPDAAWSKPPSARRARSSTCASCASVSPTGWCNRSTGCSRSSSTRSTPIASSASSRPTGPAPTCSTPRSCPTRRTRTIETVRGTIDAAHPSLIAAMTGAGENIQLAMALADIFSGQIDFDSDLQPGDSFEVLFEKSSRDGQFAGYGADPRGAVRRRRPRARGLPLVQPGRPRAAGYYDATGRSLKRFMLRIAAQVRAAHHLRLLAQPPPSGRPDVSRASRRRLRRAGRRAGRRRLVRRRGVGGLGGGGGNKVQLRHGDGFETYYLHLSAFGPGIRAGVARRSGRS